jgi:hypothetical protein
MDQIMEIVKEFSGEIIGLLILFIAAPLGKRLGSILKNKINEIKHASLQHAAWILVRFAEGFFTGKGRGKEKFEYVMDRLTKKFKWASTLKLEEFVEVAVSEMKKELGNEASSAITQ